MPRLSAGIVLYRSTSGYLEVLLGHMGGPFWERKDAGAWTIPKGEYDADRGSVRRGLSRVRGGDRLPGAGDVVRRSR